MESNVPSLAEAMDYLEVRAYATKDFLAYLAVVKQTQPVGQNRVLASMNVLTHDQDAALLLAELEVPIGDMPTITAETQQQARELLGESFTLDTVLTAALPKGVAVYAVMFLAKQAMAGLGLSSNFDEANLSLKLEGLLN